MEVFDAIILGSGQAGNPLAKKFSERGKKVALVEVEKVGGSCINYGCTPTKTLVGIAKQVFQARKAENYGLTLKNDQPDYELVDRQMDKVVSDSREGLKDSLTQDPNITLFHGRGLFLGHKEVRVEFPESRHKTITANLIFIDTGVRANVPGIEGLDSVQYYTSKTILDLDSLPDHLMIIGGGSIALEFSQIFRRMGSQVTVIEQEPRLLPLEDDDVGRMVTQIIETEGVKVITHASVGRVHPAPEEGIEVEVTSEDKLFKISGSHLLLATGTMPNTEDLHLTKTGVQTDEKGFIPVNDHLETSQAGIYALGDVKGGPAFTHVSYHDHLVVTDHLFGPGTSSIQDRLVPYCLFTDPELGRIGLTEKEARKKNVDFSVAKIKTSSISRAVETDETTGFIKAIVDNNTRKILGVAAICSVGGELMSLLQIAMLGEMTYDRLRDTMFAHPTYAEAINNLFNESNIKPGVTNDGT